VLVGSGSTFVEPALRQWVERYRAIAPGVTIEYEGVGSAEALDRLHDGEGDFFTREQPLTELDEATLGGSQAIVQIPWSAGPIAVAYNLQGVEGLRLSPQTLAGIFAGRVLRWDDPSVRTDNPDVRLPSLPIQVVYRADASGTTEIFTAYIGAASGVWPGVLGSDTIVRFPRGTGVRGSEAVAAAVGASNGAVGYVQLSYARQASLSVALLGNRAGNFVAPTSDSVNAALVGAEARPFGNTARLLFTPDSPGAYPLATFSYLMFRREGLDPAKAQALRHFAMWALGEGQRMAEPLGYTVVPRPFQVPALTTLQRL
jgi:phosphate transport system substrate-binding protein